jgi:hypothetical protein
MDCSSIENLSEGTRNAPRGWQCNAETSRNYHKPNESLLHLLVFYAYINKMQGSRSKIPIKNLVRQRCVEGFNSGVKGLKLGIDPESHKYAVDRPIHKKCVKTKIKNYRPILLLIIF